jgi:cell division protein FtsA
MADEQVVVGLDVGTSKISALIGEVKRPDLVQVVGVGISPSRGLKKGLVVDMEEAAAAIAASLRKAETFSGYRIIGAFVAVSGAHLESDMIHGAVSLPGDRTVSQQDLLEVQRAARLEDVADGRQVLHVLPRGYVVDGEDGVRNPSGMVASILEMEGLVVTSALAPIQNLIRCVDRAGIQIDGLVAAGLASAQGVLSEAEKQLGVLLMDLGGGTTDLTWFKDGEVQYVGALPLGGNHLTNDISVGLGVPFSAAEEIKVRFGHAVPGNVGEDEAIDAATFSEERARKVSRRFLAEIVEARLSETFGLAMEEMQHRGYDGVLPAGVVLTGGTAQLRGIRELAQQTFRAPVRLGLPEGLAGSIDSISTSSYATGAGLLKWVLAQSDEAGGGRSMRRRVGWGGRLKGLAKAFLP